MPLKTQIKVTRDVYEQLKKLARELGVDSPNQVIKLMLEMLNSEEFDGVPPIDSDRVPPIREEGKIAALGSGECVVGRLVSGYWLVCGDGSTAFVPDPCEVAERLGLKLINFGCENG